MCLCVCMYVLFMYCMFACMHVTLVLFIEVLMYVCMYVHYDQEVFTGTP